MRRVDIIIIIDSDTRRIDYCRLENRVLEPSLHFQFKKGAWVGEFEDFPLGSDNDLDILIIAIGNPGVNSTMNVTINNVDKGNYNLFRPFNRNGYGQFNEEIPV